MRRVREPTVAVIAFPHLYTTVIARMILAHGGYAVEAPDVLSGSWRRRVPYDAVVASLPVPREWGRVLLELPDDFGLPITVSVGDLTVQIDVDQEHPLEDVLRLLDLVVDRHVEDVTATLLSMASASPRGRRDDGPRPA